MNEDESILKSGKHVTKPRTGCTCVRGFVTRGAGSSNHRRLAHVPVHPSTLGENRFTGVPMKNVHGHIHQNPSPPGPYRCVSVEQIDYTPINIEELK